MKSNTLIEKQTKKKTNPEIVETIRLARKNKAWVEIASSLSTPKRKRVELNLDEINDQVKEGDKIVVPGKILGVGEIDKKIKIIAINFSEGAKEKLLKSKIGICKIIEEIKINPEAKGVKFIK